MLNSSDEEIDAFLKGVKMKYKFLQYQGLSLQ
jgi:hypothetical protein